MKQTLLIVIALLVLIVCVICLHMYYLSRLRLEGMSSADTDIKYYAITNNQQSNIEKQQGKLKPQINIIKYNLPPMIGNEAYEQSPLYAKELIKAKCNIHIALLNKLRVDTNSTKGSFVTVIFEDDFAIVNEDFATVIAKIIDKTGSNDFDFIILENDDNDGILSKIDMNSVYTKPVNMYIINNMNIENIVSKMDNCDNVLFTDRIIDLAKMGKLNVYVYTKSNL